MILHDINPEQNSTHSKDDIAPCLLDEEATLLSYLLLGKSSVSQITWKRPGSIQGDFVLINYS